MSDFVTYSSIQLKNKILLPEVLKKYREGNLTLDALQNEQNPLNEIYRNTYGFITFPENMSPESMSLLYQTTNTKPSPQLTLKEKQDALVRLLQTGGQEIYPNNVYNPYQNNVSPLQMKITQKQPKKSWLDTILLK